MKTSSIQIVIAGLGRAGWDIHWRQLLRGHQDYHVSGVIEPASDRRAEAEGEIGCHAYASLDDFLSDPVGQVIVLATPSGGHGHEALACLKRGLHVVVDKPMCQGSSEAEEMIREAGASKRILTCYHPYRYDDEFNVIRNVVQSGRLGRIVQIKCNRSDFVRRNDWVMRRDKGGGQHNVWGSHSVDQCLRLAESPVREVFSDLQCTVTPGDADDHCKILIRCQSGVLIDTEISNCMAFPTQPEWMVAGTCGGLVSSPEGVRVRWFDPESAPPISMQDGPAANRRYDNDDTLDMQEELIPVPRGRGPVGFYDNLAAAIRGEAPLAITPESVAETIAVLEICRRQNPLIWADWAAFF